MTRLPTLGGRTLLSAGATDANPQNSTGGYGAAVLVVDDEAPALDELVYLLHTIPAIHLVDAVSSSSDALRRLKERFYNVLFLDVRMPSLDGIELAHLLRRFVNPPGVVFVTAYEEYAVNAFEVSASDYLVKPVSRTRLISAVERALKYAHGSGELRPTADNVHETVPVETAGRIHLIDRAQVCWIAAEGDYVRLHLADGSSHLVRVPISHLDARWSPHGFIRIHRSYLVRAKYITEFAVVGGNHTVTVAGHELPVSRRHAREVRDWFLHAPKGG